MVIKTATVSTFTKLKLAFKKKSKQKNAYNVALAFNIDSIFLYAMIKHDCRQTSNNARKILII